MHRLCSRRLVTLSRRLQSSLCAPHPRLYPTTAILRSFPNSALNAPPKYERNNRFRQSSGAGHAAFEEIPTHDWELVIFDKDGTLFDASRTWQDWATHVGTALRAISSEAEAKFYERMGFDPVSGVVGGTGLLATRPWTEINDCISVLLATHGKMDLEQAANQVARWSHEVDTVSGQVPLFDIKAMFSRLRELNIKIAINTADDRVATERILDAFDLTDDVDLVLSSSDNPHPKPHPDSAHYICSALQVDPLNTIVVGDTQADVLLGRNAKLGLSVGVLSGACSQDELSTHSDIMLADATLLLPMLERSSLNRAEAEA
eukprot:m.129551 g.129551  ORF g.129551 m.129551 type:complete len:318 (+) comp15851_c0_seq4:2752-3705(+)